MPSFATMVATISLKFGYQIWFWLSILWLNIPVLIAMIAFRFYCTFLFGRSSCFLYVAIPFTSFLYRSIYSARSISIATLISLSSATHLYNFSIISDGYAFKRHPFSRLESAVAYSVCALFFSLLNLAFISSTVSC